MTGPEVVARRFDQLAGRLGTLANAMAVADRYGWRFGLAWPMSRDESVNRPSELFAPSFLADHGLTEDDLDGRVGVPCEDLEAAVRRREELVAAIPEHTPFLDIPGPFELLTATVEGNERARARLRRVFGGVAWADELRPVVEFCANWAEGEQWTGFHVRAGDTIVGPWRNGMWHEKYLPTSCLAAALDECERRGTPVLLCSDHPEYADWLRSRHADVRQATDVLPGFAALTPIQRAFAEILLLSRCDRIIGPPRSAFSGLAAMLGCGTVTRSDELCPDSTDRIRIEASLDTLEAAAGDLPFLLPFVARDACWWADVYADEVGADGMLRVLRRATRADPEFAAAWARRARTAARAGRTSEAGRAVRRAEALAAADLRHDDPVADAMAARVVVETCASAGPLRSQVRGVVARHLRTAADAVDRCRTLEPFVIRRAELTVALDGLVGAAAQLAALPPGRRRVAERDLRTALGRPLAGGPGNGVPGNGVPTNGVPSATGVVHPTRREAQRAAVSFDPVPDEIDLIRSLFEGVQPVTGAPGAEGVGGLP